MPKLGPHSATVYGECGIRFITGEVDDMEIHSPITREIVTDWYVCAECYNRSPIVWNTVVVVW
jgi:hypothetical protein